MVSAQAAPVPSRATHRGDIWPDERPFTAIWVLLLCQAGACGHPGTRGKPGKARGSRCGRDGFRRWLWARIRERVVVPYPSTADASVAEHRGGVSRDDNGCPADAARPAAVHVLRRATTRANVERYRVVAPPLLTDHPTLGVSPRYPGLESVAALFHQLGLPVMVAAIAVVLVARLALVVVLCDAVEHLTGSPRAGGLAVAVYAVSAHFVCFNTTFSYQTLALSLALAAVAFIARARWAADPRPLFGGATVCLLAVAVTHHLTSWLTAAFLVFWATAEGGQARRRVFYGAVFAAVTTTAWAMIQWSILRDYFGPMIDDLGSQLRAKGAVGRSTTRRVGQRHCGSGSFSSTTPQLWLWWCRY